MPIRPGEIAKRRQALELTLEAAAARAGMTRQRWHDIESGRYPNPRLDTLEAVCGALGCGIDELRTGRTKR